MKLHLPKQLFTALLAAAAGFQQAGAETTETTVDYSVYENYTPPILRWLGTDGKISKGYWYVQEYSDGALSDKAGGQTGVSGETNGYSTHLQQFKTLLFDENSTRLADAQFNTYEANTAYVYDLDDLKLSGIVVKKGALGSVLLSSASTGDKRDIILGAETAEYTAHSLFEENFTIDTRASNITLQNKQQWQVETGKTLKVGAFGNTEKTISQGADGTLTIAGGGSVEFHSKFENNGTLTVNSGATLTSSSAFTNAAGASVTISGALTSTGAFTNNGEVDVYGMLSTSSQGTIGTMNIKAGGVLDVTKWSDKTTFGTLNDLNTLTTSSDNSGVGYIKLDVPSDNDGREVALSTASTSLNKNFWFVDNAPALHGGSAAGGRTLEIGESKYLRADAGIEAWSDATIAVSGGHLEAKHIILGHYSVGSHHYGALTMSSGSITTGTIKFNKQTGNAVTITGGSLEFTTSNALEYTSANSNSPDTTASVSISGATLKATQTAWTLDGSVLTTAPTIGNVTIDGANTYGITLKGVSLEGSITNNASLTLSGTLDFSGATLTTESALITLGTGASLTINEGAVFKFGDLAAGTKYKVIGASDGSTLSGWESITAEQIYINGAQLNSSGFSITTSGGVFSFSQLISSLTWNGSANDGIWNATSQNWTTGSASSAYVNAIDTSFTSDATATVAEAITTGNLTIGEENAQSGITVTLSAVDDGSLTVANDRILSINNNSTLNSALGIEVSGATVSMGAGASWNLTDSAQQKLTGDQLSAVTAMHIGENASLTVDATAAAALSTIDASMLTGTGTVALSMNNNTSNGLKADLSNFTGTIQLGDGAAGDTTDRYDSTEYLIYTGSDINTSATISLLNGGGLAFSDTTSTAELPEKMTNALVVSNGGSAEQTKAGSTVHVDDSVYAEISGGISGTGQLFKKGAGTLSLSGNTTVSALKIMDGTLNLGGTASLTYLGVGGGSSVTDSTILNITGTVSANQLRIGEQGHAAVNIKSGGSLTINGTDSSISTNRSLLLTHWGQGSTLTLDGGNLTSTGARMFLSWTGKGTFKANSGEANLLGIDFLAQSSGKRGNFDLGSATEGSARVNIGADGIANVDSADVAIKLGEGTLGALSDWVMAANTNNAGNVQLIGTNGGTVFNTQNPKDSTGHTITINASLSGSGKLVKDGLGTLALSGANTYSGGTTIEAGTVTTQHASALGTGDVNMTGGELVVSGVDNPDTDLTVGGAIVMNAAATAKLATTDTTLSLGTTGSVKKTDAGGTQYVTISSDGTNAASMTAKADNAQLVQLQQETTFTIQDMTLTNTTITAATPTTQVKLQNVEATNLALAQGKFTMNVAPTVGEGGTTAEFGSGVVSLLAVGSASLTLNMDVIGAYESTGAMDNVTLIITLDGITGDVSGYGVDNWKALVGFEENSWLGHALTGAQYSVPGVATAAESGVPSVNYGYEATGGEGSNVGTLTIIITGLNVPEPASATLGLAALMMLCARRRRND